MKNQISMETPSKIQLYTKREQQRPRHTSVLIFCLLCTIVYVYLYANISFKTETVSTFMKDAIDDLGIWKNELELILKSSFLNGRGNITEVNLSKKRNNQSTESSDNRKGVEPTTLLTIFTTFVSSAEKYVCRNNTLRNWKSFEPLVKPIFFSDDAALSDKVKSMGWWDVQKPRKTAVGIPILKFMYLDAMKRYPAKFYAYANGDLLFIQNLIDTLQFISNSKQINQTHPMLIVGQRTNVKGVTEAQASTYENIANLSKKGQLFTPWGEDYFITNSVYPWTDFPEVVVGRRAYDNWIVLNANKRRHTTIDATRTLLALHQTTSKGNKEGHAHKDSNFNSNLLGRLYKKINYGSGLTSCTRKYTAYDPVNHSIHIKDRKGC